MAPNTALMLLVELYSQQPVALGKRARIEQALRQAIAQHLSNGFRLPSHRELASTLGVARHTLALAVGTLLEEQLLITAHGQGTWVHKPKPFSHTRQASAQVSTRAQKILLGPGASTVQSGAFVPGVPDIAQFPMRKWRQLYASVTVPHNALLLSYSTGGYGPLKRAIRDFLRRWRHIECDIEQIIITDGTHNGIQLCAMALADVGDTVAMESPCYWGARNVFTAAGLNTQLIPWHPDKGHTLPRAVSPVTLVYLTGSHHYPLSVPTNMAHKQALCAALSPAYIVEDDYEFGRHDHTQLLFDADSTRHFLVGSFSKLMFPGLRLGYLVVPRHLSAPINRLRSELFREGRMLEQAVLAQFMFDGDLDLWCQRIQRDYLGRQQVMHDKLHSLPRTLNVSPPSAAISLCMELEATVNDVALAQALLKEHLVVRPLSPVCAEEDPRSGLVMGVGMLSGETLAREATRLRQCLKERLSG